MKLAILTIALLCSWFSLTASAEAQIQTRTQVVQQRALFARERAAIRVVLGSGNSYRAELSRIRKEGWLLNRRRPAVYRR